jgi:hypothetical protein
VRPMGVPLHRSEVIATIQAVRGVAACELTRFAEYGSQSAGGLEALPDSPPAWVVGQSTTSLVGLAPEVTETFQLLAGGHE